MACPSCGSSRYEEIGDLESSKWVSCLECKFDYPLSQKNKTLVVNIHDSLEKIN